jgi:hypothetical protein
MVDDNGNDRQRRAIVSRTAKLPQHGFESVRPQVQALADLAAPSTKERIAEQLGVAAKGRFTGKLAAAGYFGFIERTGDGRLQLTERGRTFLGEDTDAKLRAMREGVMSTNFGPIIYLLRSQEPKEKVIAARLQDDVGVPGASADAVAKMLVSISTEAQLIGENGRFSAAAIEDTYAAVESAGQLPEKPAPKREAESPAASEPRTPRSPRRSAETKPEASGTNGAGETSGPFVMAPVQVVVNVDASKLSTQQIADLVRALQTPPPRVT